MIGPIKESRKFAKKLNKELKYIIDNSKNYYLNEFIIELMKETKSIEDKLKRLEEIERCNENKND